jgi:hypothetical protein
VGIESSRLSDLMNFQIQIEEPDLESGVVDEEPFLISGGFGPGSASPDAVALMKTSSKVTPLEMNEDLMDKCSQQTVSHSDH